jgi:hypothetical protein
MLHRNQVGEGKDKDYKLRQAKLYPSAEEKQSSGKQV